MNFKEWWGYSPYKKLWSLIGGRPWTHIKRDLWHSYEILHIFFYITVGFLLRHWLIWILRWIFSDWHNLIIVIIISVGFGMLIAHFYWGTKWQKGQRE